MLLLVICYVEILKLMYYLYNMIVYGFNDEIWCSWNCIDIDFYLMEEMKMVIIKNKIIWFVVKYEVMDKCVD